ncbi:serine protease inhibitor Kazal-type 12-like [Polypterus senegalus]|uniref:serine protease inhibitor Kazal-type 12-like n=1 Tax=Polypterus senegalus TaxID=55291 RepID=UPI001964CC41|nr:serine protease inhibitor Kazal-type 12-like [Polypterus senegalus]
MSAMRLLLLCVAFICLSVLTCQADVVQPNCRNACVKGSKPIGHVCGSNGRTYESQCAFCIDKHFYNSGNNVVKYEDC